MADTQEQKPTVTLHWSVPQSHLEVQDRHLICMHYNLLANISRTPVLACECNNTHKSKAE